MIRYALALMLVAFSAQAANLDLAKFRAKGQAETQKIVGVENVLEEGRVIFRDGAGSTDLEPFFDYGAFYYVVPVKDGVLPKGASLAYRLWLNGTEDAVLVEISGEPASLVVSMPDSGIVTLVEGASQKDVDALLAELRAKAPEGEFTYLKNIKILTYQVKVLEMASTYQLLRGSKIVQAIDQNYEVYRTPFEFDPPQEIGETGVIDADKFRGVVKRLREEGWKFASETTVPEDLAGDTPKQEIPPRK